MIFKTSNREKISKVLFVTTIATIFSLFFYRVLDFHSPSYFIAICIFALFLIIMITVYEEHHILDNRILIKCFYYEKVMTPTDIDHVVIQKYNIIFYKKHKKKWHTFLKMDNEKYEAIVQFIKRNKIAYIIK